MHKSTRLRLALGVTAALMSGACRHAGHGVDYRTAATEPGRNIADAQKANAKGLQAIEKKEFKDAEGHFRAAVGYDLYSAAAHNNLGLVLLDPQNLSVMRNLARAYVKADRRDDKLRRILDLILLQPPDNPQWDVWARGQIVRLGRPADGGSHIPPFGQK